jgi:hypothetical protein
MTGSILITSFLEGGVGSYLGQATKASINFGNQGNLGGFDFGNLGFANWPNNHAWLDFFTEKIPDGISAGIGLTDSWLWGKIIPQWK